MKAMLVLTIAVTYTLAFGGTVRADAVGALAATGDAPFQHHSTAHSIGTGPSPSGK